MLGAVASLLACPVCGDGLRVDAVDAAVADSRAGSTARPRRLLCARGHTYDVARQGHVSLLAGNHRHVGDTAAMVAHRIAFLAAGHYDPVADAMADLAAAANAPGVLLDIGGGPGWYAARLLAALPDRAGITLDASTHAARRAARAHPRLASVVADGTAGYPLRDATVAIATCVFAPRHGAEIARVLAPGGRLLVVTPTPEHLTQVRGPLGLLAIGADKQARLAEALTGGAGLVPRERREVRRVLALTHEDSEHLALMGPAAYHLDPVDLAARIATMPAHVEANLDVLVQAYTAP